MNQEELKNQTKAFSLRIIRLADAVPPTKSGEAIARQIIRSGTSVGANYRSACKAKSDRDFLNKMVIIEEEADETQYWLELLQESGLMKSELVESLLQESKELTAIFTASGRMVRERIQTATISKGANGKIAESFAPYNSEFEIRNSESFDLK